jgi:putative mRNA 3-end processing factor
MISNPLVTLTENGFHCPAGDFFIDPWRPVEKAVVTHAHGDHARWGSTKYLAAAPGEPLLRGRLGDDIDLTALPYGESIALGGVRISLPPAGHVLGSAQVRIEKDGLVTVVSGDYKEVPDPTCEPLEPVPCHHFISESTFGLPVFRWEPEADLFAEINAWWRENAEVGRTTLMFAYALGKAQRVLARLDSEIGPIFIHGAVEKVTERYRIAGIDLPPTRPVSAAESKDAFAGAMVIAPPSADTPAWTRRFIDPARGFASGWMRIRGNRRRRNVDRGFVLSDHADWPGLLATIRATGAETVWTTHGYADELARALRDDGLDAQAVRTRSNDGFTGEADDDSAAL